MKSKTFFIILISLLLLIAFPISSCSKAPETPVKTYPYLYNVGDICSNKSGRSEYLKFEPAKDDELSGKLVVEDGSVVFYINDVYGRRVEDAGRITSGEDYSFTIKAEQSGFSYKCWFKYEFLTYPWGAKFYSNVPADESSSMVTAYLDTAYIKAPVYDIYISDEYGYSIAYPNDWNVSVNSEDRTVIIENLPYCQVKIEAEHSIGRGKYFTLEDCAQKRINDLIGLKTYRIVKNLEIVDSRPTGEDSWEIVYYNVSMGNDTFLIKETYVSKLEYLYRITSSEYLAHNYSSYWKTLDYMVNSFEPT